MLPNELNMQTENRISQIVMNLVFKVDGAKRALMTALTINYSKALN